jgi:hypothetical protein
MPIFSRNFETPRIFPKVGVMIGECFLIRNSSYHDQSILSDVLFI